MYCWLQSYSDYKGLASLGQVKLRKSDPGGTELEAEEELLMGAKIGFQRLCHLRHKAGQCPQIHSGGKVNQSSSIDGHLCQERKEANACVCVYVG